MRHPDDDFSAYEADAKPAGEGELSAITRLAAELREAQAHVHTCEEHLKAAQARATLLEQIDLPAAMDAAQQTKLTTLDGWDLERTETLRASISAANMPAAVMFLRSVGRGSIVKRDVSAQFGLGEEQKAAEAVDLLKNAGFPPTDKQSVNAMTLGAAVREMMEEGIEVPAEILGVFIQPKVRMKESKSKTATRRRG